MDECIIEYWSTKGRTICNIDSFADKQECFRSEIMLEEEGGSVTEYELIPDSKLLLFDFLTYIQRELKVRSTPKIIDLGYRVYLIKEDN